MTYYRLNDMDSDMNKAKRSLYDEALACFHKEAAEQHSSPKDLELLAEFLRERATPGQTKQAAEVLQSDAGKKWGGRKIGDVEIPESWIANIMANIEIFVAAGDFVTKDAPESVGMAWYAVKLTLTAIHGNYDLYTFFGSGLSDISEIMIIVRHYDRLYDERSKPHWKPSPLVEKLFQDVIRAYADVLHFSFAVKRHLTAGALTKIKHGFKDFFGLSKAKFEEKLNTVAAQKKKILEESQGAFQDKTLTQLQGVSTVLAGIEGTVQHIRNFQETQQKLHEDAMVKFDALLKGLDDIKASTKRKTQWDYAVQDFQSFQDVLSPLQGSFKVLGDTIDAVYPGTCQWIFEERAYRQWADAAGNVVLCITGPEGSGKSYVVASIANRITQVADPYKVLLYVTCGGSTGGLGNSQSYTADSICRTILSQLYDLAAQGEDSVGLLEACNAVFKRAKAKSLSIPNYMRTDNDGLPEFADGFSRIAALLKKNVVLVLDGLDKNTLDDKNREELARKIRGLMAAVSDGAGIRLHILIGYSWSVRLFDDVNLPPESYIEYIDVQHHNRGDIELILSDALKDVPGLSQAEQETAKAAILEKARSRFLYVQDTAIPFMREPFQRPLSKRLEGLPDGASDVYAKALRSMSPNYLELLRTALTWTLLCPDFPGYPHAREIMDAFQGTYDYPSETEEGDIADFDAGFPLTNRLELEQLRGASEPFLTLFPEEDGRVWVWESDAAALSEYFIKSGADAHEEPEHHELLCARCGSARSLAKNLYIDPKKVHLQMALTCLRHLNNPLFQRRARLAAVGRRHERGSGAENSLDGTRGDEEGDTEPTGPATPTDPVDTDDRNANALDAYLQEAQDGYQTEDSIDDEDITKPQIHDQAMFDTESDSDDEETGEGATRVRYEIQYWPWHMRKAEELWPAEEREENSEWAALMVELDKLVFDTPRIFSAWQAMHPDKKNEENLFAVANGPHKPLHVAAYLGLSSWVKHLLDRGEELNGLSAGYSPLQAAACSGGPLDTMKLLLEKGADVNAENNAGRNSFHLFLMRFDITLEGAKLLLEHGADARASCSLVHYSVMQYFASRGKDPEILELLLAHGADINAVHPNSVSNLPALHLLLLRRERTPFPQELCRSSFLWTAGSRASELFCSLRCSRLTTPTFTAQRLSTKQLFLVMPNA
ncbi:hypothetical protein N657DRAFT_175938 [Parathielavia appendiculata]|uniref:Nephrocystin 3-like N-terminal domain-containing protein n=1 Tax=Parathielavia appendiculata TaxID=2587402 RepID=A0AAN6U5E6_9PEZI|nr:hypothetical protein N657DRAFT_175938 [Parathielavia appendiculata]